MIEQASQSNDTLPLQNPVVITSSGTFPKKTMLIVLGFLLTISLLINVFQFLGYVPSDLYMKYPKKFAISPDNPKLLKYGMTYYLEGQIQEIKKEGNNFELITDISELPKAYIEGNTNILIKQGDQYTNGTKDQLIPGAKVNILLFNENMEKWFVARVVLLP